MSPAAREDAQATILVGIARGASVPQACWLAGISVSTLGRWRREDPVFDCKMFDELTHYADVQRQQAEVRQVEALCGQPGALPPDIGFYTVAPGATTRGVEGLYFDGAYHPVYDLPASDSDAVLDISRDEHFARLQAAFCDRPVILAWLQVQYAKQTR